MEVQVERDGRRREIAGCSTGVGGASACCPAPAEARTPRRATAPPGGALCRMPPPFATLVLVVSTVLSIAGLSKGLFPSSLLTNTLYAFLDSPIRATCPAHLKRLDLMSQIMSAPNIFLRILFSNTLNLCSSLKSESPSFTTIQNNG
ncbi:hypothetical protein ANN_05775 [Periplaneta americana]|uniref:Uncharacterized protein n=1 Tax=Periplaneta americana TaxID=6978 RepID=A0ABQ8TDG4_PERAM|nr:hypothetical protein ANN_05775 [Periplaneta americana]